MWRRSTGPVWWRRWARGEPEPTSSVDAEAGPSASKRGEAEGVFGRRDEDEDACSEDKVARE
jgi:hypothetical protein